MLGYRVQLIRDALFYVGSSLLAPRVAQRCSSQVCSHQLATSVEDKAPGTPLEKADSNAVKILSILMLKVPQQLDISEHLLIPLAAELSER